MKGNIITTERCMVCNAVLKHDDRRNGLFCPEHPQVSAVKIFIVRFGRYIQKQFSSYDKASQFLIGLRFKTSEGTFDHKDYSAEKPYSFHNLADKYLKRKRTLKSIKERRRHIKVAEERFFDRNVKYITGADIEDFLFDIPDISEHETNKAFDRYCQYQSDTAFKMASLLKDRGKVQQFPGKAENE